MSTNKRRPLLIMQDAPRTTSTDEEPIESLGDPKGGEDGEDGCGDVDESRGALVVPDTEEGPG